VGTLRFTALIAVLMAAYPVLVYFGMRQGIPGRWIALGLLFLLALRWGRTVFRILPGYVLIAIAAGAAFLAWFRGESSVLFYPAAVNAVLLVIFGISLWMPPTVIERLARLRHPDLDGHGVRYTRRVTQVWCGFFAVNGSVAVATALKGDAAVWAFYNGFLAYVLMGVLFGGEWLVRRRVMAGKTT
jgi:uncharacterized membrane protein